MLGPYQPESVNTARRWVGALFCSRKNSFVAHKYNDKLWDTIDDEFKSAYSDFVDTLVTSEGFEDKSRFGEANGGGPLFSHGGDQADPRKVYLGLCKAMGAGWGCSKRHDCSVASFLSAVGDVVFQKLCDRLESEGFLFMYSSLNGTSESAIMRAEYDFCVYVQRVSRLLVLASVDVNSLHSLKLLLREQEQDGRIVIARELVLLMELLKSEIVKCDNGFAFKQSKDGRICQNNWGSKLEIDLTGGGDEEDGEAGAGFYFERNEIEHIGLANGIYLVGDEAKLLVRCSEVYRARLQAMLAECHFTICGSVRYMIQAG